MLLYNKITSSDVPSGRYFLINVIPSVKHTLYNGERITTAKHYINSNMSWLPEQMLVGALQSHFIKWYTHCTEYTSYNVLFSVQYWHPQHIHHSCIFCLTHTTCQWHYQTILSTFKHACFECSSKLRSTTSSYSLSICVDLLQSLGGRLHTDAVCPHGQRPRLAYYLAHQLRTLIISRWEQSKTSYLVPISHNELF